MRKNKGYEKNIVPVELNVESALDEASVVTVKSSESDSNVLKESLGINKRVK